jgi:hypothetical protein
MTIALGRWSIRGVLVAAALVFGLAWTGLRPAPAFADGDPASDVLLAQDVFYPYQPPVSPTVERALEQTLRMAARATGVHLKVAIIGAPQELGIVPYLFGHPQRYASFLDREITFNEPQSLLVVMPAGFGAIPTSLGSALTRVPIDTRHGSDGLTRSAILAVVAIARTRGHPIALPSISPSSSHSSPPAVLVFGLPVILVIFVGFVLRHRARQRKESAE